MSDPPPLTPHTHTHQRNSETVVFVLHVCRVRRKVTGIECREGVSVEGVPGAIVVTEECSIMM